MMSQHTKNVIINEHFAAAMCAQRSTATVHTALFTYGAIRQEYAAQLSDVEEGSSGPCKSAVGPGNGRPLLFSPGRVVLVHTYRISFYGE